MDWLYDWLKQLILLVLLATVLDLLLPRLSLQRYVQFTMGMLIMVAMISPVFQLFKVDLKQLVADSIRTHSTSTLPDLSAIQAAGQALEEQQQALITETAQKKIEKEVKKQVEQAYDVQVASIQLQLAGDARSVKQIALVINTQPQTDSTVIKPIEIAVERQSSQPEPSMVTTPLTEEIGQWLSKQWQISIRQIDVKEEKGEVIP